MVNWQNYLKPTRRNSAKTDHMWGSMLKEEKNQARTVTAEKGKEIYAT